MKKLRLVLEVLVIVFFALWSMKVRMMENKNPMLGKKSDSYFQWETVPSQQQTTKDSINSMKAIYYYMYW